MCLSSNPVREGIRLVNVVNDVRILPVERPSEFTSVLNFKGKFRGRERESERETADRKCDLLSINTLGKVQK